MKPQELILLVIVVTACGCLASLFIAPFFDKTMPENLVAFITNLVLFLVGGGTGAGALLFGQRQGEQQERARILGIPKEH